MSNDAGSQREVPIRDGFASATLEGVYASAIYVDDGTATDETAGVVTRIDLPVTHFWPSREEAVIVWNSSGVLRIDLGMTP